jgi:hypothetical protein
MHRVFGIPADSRTNRPTSWMPGLTWRLHRRQTVFLPLDSILPPLDSLTGPEKLLVGSCGSSARQGPTVASVDGYDDGVLHFVVNDGAQSTRNGSSTDNAARASWSFEYSIATGLNGATTDLSDFTFKLLYDVDPL